ncbi:hypothetical protein CCACVL1_11551 [Corchorus capsularis]|uniref:Uncharacterized protein n=1 Tax=Corchorus capsularis TaxID=210143 RepID=A0A1R3IKM0_COCAP|nr:hypothetical protein CCACVL1_11551 [Corchorus capsularis]
MSQTPPKSLQTNLAESDIQTCRYKKIQPTDEANPKDPTQLSMSLRMRKMREDL